MNETNQRWWAEQAQAMPVRQHPQDLLRMPLSDADYLDAAVIGGVRFGDIVAGRIAEHEIPPGVLEAYHQQYPHLNPNLMDEVHHLHRDPARLRGLAAGIKGKLFEDDYVAWLNHGHLPAGAHAALAASPTNPGWDIRITDAHGHVMQVLQLKATDNLHIIQAAVDQHPQINVVTTRELFDHISTHHDLIQHTIDSGMSNHALGHTVHQSLHHLSAHDPFAMHVPVLAIALSAAMEMRRYRKGEQDLITAGRNIGARSLLSLLATGAAWAAAAATGATGVGIPAGILTRLSAGWAQRQLEFRAYLRRSTLRLQHACAALAALPAR